MQNQRYNNKVNQKVQIYFKNIKGNGKIVN